MDSAPSSSIQAKLEFLQLLAPKTTPTVTVGVTETMFGEATETKDLRAAYTTLLGVHDTIAQALGEGPDWSELVERFKALNLTTNQLGKTSVTNTADARNAHRERIEAATVTARALEVDVGARPEQIRGLVERRRTAAERLARRLVALNEGPYANKPAIAAIDREIRGAVGDDDTAAGIRELENVNRVLTAVEKASSDFGEGLDDAKERVEALVENGFLPKRDLDPLTTEVGKIENVGKNQKLTDAAQRLQSFEVELVRAERAAAEEEEASVEYPGLLETVRTALADFPTRSAAHRGWTIRPAQKAFEDAQARADEKAFVVARGALEDALNKLAEYDARATARQADSDEATQNEAAAAANRLAAARAEQARQAAQALAEAAADCTALTAIGKTRQFSKWLRKVKELLDAGTVAIAAGGPFLLRFGNTVEVICTVTGTGYRDTFVVHYHPDAAKATVGSAWASQIHAKPIRGNAQTPRVYLENSHWLVADSHVPKFSTVKAMFR